MNELTKTIELWRSLVGTPPEPEQFLYWLRTYPQEVQYGILKVAAKNVKLNGQMTSLHQVRYATRCMRTKCEAKVMVPNNPMMGDRRNSAE